MKALSTDVWVEWASPPHLPSSARWRVALLVRLSLVSLAFLPFFGILHCVLYREAVLIPVITVFILGGLGSLMVVLRYTRSLTAAGVGILVAHTVPLLLVSSAYDGLGSISFHWLGFGLLLSTLVGDLKVGAVGAGFTVAAILSIHAWASPSPLNVPAEVLEIGTMINYALLAIVSVFWGAMVLSAQLRAEEAAAAAREVARRFERNAILGDRLASVGLFAAGVAHEINNPLTSVRANLAFLSDAIDDTPKHELEEAIADADDASRRVGETVRLLQTFARMKEDASTAADLSAAVYAACRMLKSALGSVRVDVRIEGRPRVFGAEGQIAQVLINLLSNALEAGPPDQVVTLIARPAEEQEVWVEVTDQGPGVAFELRDRIFEPFFTTKPVGEGTGLGLAVSYGLAKRWGARLELANPGQAGACFRLRLPAAEP